MGSDDASHFHTFTIILPIIVQPFFSLYISQFRLNQARHFKTKSPSSEMCRVLFRSHTCGHELTLKRKPCFLVKNQLQCTDEEKTLVKRSRHDCIRCRRQQRQRVSEPLTNHARSSRPDPTTIIANLQALCAKVVAEQHQAEAIPKPEVKQSISTEVEVPMSKDSATGTGIRLPAAKNLSSKSANEMNPDSGRCSSISKPSNAHIKHCKDEDQRPEIISEPWTPLQPQKAAAPLNIKEGKSPLQLTLCPHRTKYQNTTLPTIKQSTAIGSDPDPARHSHQRRRHSPTPRSA